MDLFPECSVEDLIKHAIAAMKKSQDVKLTEKNLDISVVGLNTPFSTLSEENIKKSLNDGMVIDG